MQRSKAALMRSVKARTQDAQQDTVCSESRGALQCCGAILIKC